MVIVIVGRLLGCGVWILCVLRKLYIILVIVGKNVNKY